MEENRRRRYNRQHLILRSKLRDLDALTDQVLASEEYDIGTDREAAARIAGEEIRRRRYTCENGEVRWHYLRPKPLSASEAFACEQEAVHYSGTDLAIENHTMAIARARGGRA